MKKALFLALALSVILAGTAMAGVIGTNHDLSSAGPSNQFNTTKVCIFCHVPHNAYVNPTGGNYSNTYPLWNHQLSSVTNYGIYASDTMNASPTDWGGASLSKGALCMSCHDGTVAVNNLYGGYGIPFAAIATPGLDANYMITGGANIGTDLSNDHPVNFTYNAALATADGGLASPVNGSYVDAGQSLPLYSGTMQCATCHKVHDNTLRPFLRMTQATSTICRTCHINK